MTSTKVPGNLNVLVPATVMELAQKNGSVIVNPPPSQRVPRVTVVMIGDLVCDRVWEFLRVVDPNINRRPVTIALLFRGYGNEVGTAVVKLTNVLFSDVPRLDFEHPLELDHIYGIHSFWGSFILAIAKISDDVGACCIADPNGDFFRETVEYFHEPVQLPPGPCEKCKILGEYNKDMLDVPPGCELTDSTFTCPHCGQNWWQFTTVWHKWRSVTKDAVLAIRRAESPFSLGGLMPTRFTITDLAKFNDGQEVQQVFPARFRMFPGHTFVCRADDGIGEVVGGGELSADGQTRMYTVKRVILSDV